VGKALVPILIVGYLVVAAALWAIGLLMGGNPLHLAAYSLLALIPFALAYGVAKILAMRKEKAFEAKISEGSAGGAGGSEMQAQFQKGVKLIRESAYTKTALTQLPWYLIIGAPGSGKSTAIRESGLTFPSVGQGLRSFRGIGGTRNVDWWITDEAFFLDTAGRYTTRPDDRDEWFAFLDLIKQHRKQMPLNGILVTVSALDLIKKDEAAMEAHAQIIRDRIEEVATRLEVRLPVYVLFTKCDLISGFKNFFGGLSGGEQDQVLGATLAWPPPEGGDEAQRFADEVNRLKPGLTTHRLKVVSQGLADDAEAVKSVRFPSQLARVTGFMEHFIGALFRAGRIREVAGLRGFYLTSGTQPGADGTTPPGGTPAQAPAPEAPKPAEAAPRAAADDLERPAVADHLGQRGLVGRGLQRQRHSAASARCAATVSSGKTLPGFSSQAGSNTSFTAICAAMSSAVNCAPIRSRFSTPTPCSPVRQPPTSTHRRRMSAPKASVFSRSPGLLAS